MLRRCVILSGFFFPIIIYQILDVDREGLTKLKKAVKAMHASGNGKNKEFFFCCFLNYFLGMYTHTCLVYEVEDLFFFPNKTELHSSFFFVTNPILELL